MKVYPLLLLLFLAFMACRKTDYPTIADPTFIRVFNDLQFALTLENKDDPQPFLVFMMDPKTDESGTITGAETVGDFLDQRDPWARPYPDAGNTSLWQKEYPGSYKVMAAPILNNFDLSSWAQASSGKHRIVIATRARNNVPFFNLQPRLRQNILVDTTIQLDAREVYTLHVLQQSAITRKTGLYIRKEDFWKQPFSDSLMYVNFYNLSAEGYASDAIKRGDLAFMRDTMHVFCTILGEDGILRGINGLLMDRVVRSQESHVTPYRQFPLFSDTSTNRIYTGPTSQLFTFLSPGYGFDSHPFFEGYPSQGNFLTLYCGPYHAPNPYFAIPCDLRTGLIVSVHSGGNNPRSFATVNSIEFVNGKMFVTTIQRRYDPPIY